MECLLIRTVISLAIGGNHFQVNAFALSDLLELTNINFDNALSRFATSINLSLQPYFHQGGMKSFCFILTTF